MELLRKRKGWQSNDNLTTIHDDTWITEVCSASSTCPQIQKDGIIQTSLAVPLEIRIKSLPMVEGDHHQIDPQPPSTIIGSDNGLSPVCRQAIIWTNAELLSIGP